MSTFRDPLYRRHRLPPEVISYVVWLYFRLRMVEQMQAAPWDFCVTQEIVCQWGKKFGTAFSDQIRQLAATRRHMDELVVSITGGQLRL